MTNEEFFAQLDALGAAEVRARLATNVYLGGHAALVRSWLERRSEASNVEQIEIARDARDAAWTAARAAETANNKATTAIRIAIASIIVAIIAMVVGVIGPRFLAP